MYDGPIDSGMDQTPKTNFSFMDRYGPRQHNSGKSNSFMGGGLKGLGGYKLGDTPTFSRPGRGITNGLMRGQDSPEQTQEYNQQRRQMPHFRPSQRPNQMPQQAPPIPGQVTGPMPNPGIPSVSPPNQAPMQTPQMGMPDLSWMDRFRSQQSTQTPSWLYDLFQPRWGQMFNWFQ